MMWKMLIERRPTLRKFSAIEWKTLQCTPKWFLKREKETLTHNVVSFLWYRFDSVKKRDARQQKLMRFPRDIRRLPSSFRIRTPECITMWHGWWIIEKKNITLKWHSENCHIIVFSWWKEWGEWMKWLMEGWVHFHYKRSRMKERNVFNLL